MAFGKFVTNILIGYKFISPMDVIGEIDAVVNDRRMQTFVTIPPEVIRPRITRNVVRPVRPSVRSSARASARPSVRPPARPPARPPVIFYFKII